MPAHDTPSSGEITRLIHSTPLPCGKSHETGKRSDLAGHAGYGYCASRSRYFWGLPPLPELHTRANSCRLGTSEPEDRGTRSRRRELRRKKEKPSLGELGRPTIPGVYSRVAGRLLTLALARALALALAAGIWHDWLIGAPNNRSLIAHDHEDSLI